MSPRTARSLGLISQMADNVNFVRVKFDIVRKLRFKHKDLRDLVATTGKSIGELFADPFGGWPYILLYALRHQDLKLSVDRCSEFIDLWVEENPVDESSTDKRMPLDSLGEKILEALNASGFVRIKAENKLDDAPSAEGNETPEDA
jgi:hypothetical protein